MADAANIINRLSGEELEKLVRNLDHKKRKQENKKQEKKVVSEKPRKVKKLSEVEKPCSTCLSVKRYLSQGPQQLTNSSSIKDFRFIYSNHRSALKRLHHVKEPTKTKKMVHLDMESGDDDSAREEAYQEFAHQADVDAGVYD